MLDEWQIRFRRVKETATRQYRKASTVLLAPISAQQHFLAIWHTGCLKDAFIAQENSAALIEPHCSTGRKRRE